MSTISYIDDDTKLGIIEGLLFDSNFGKTNWHNTHPSNQKYSICPLSRPHRVNKCCVGDLSHREFDRNGE